MEELVKRVAEKAGMPKKMTKDLIYALFDELKEIIKEKGQFRIRGFGELRYKPKGGVRKIYNPIKGEVEYRDAPATVRFKKSRNGTWD